jgi:hypothetical protein
MSLWVNNDIGSERIRPGPPGAGGTHVVTFGSPPFENPVRAGANVTEQPGTVTLVPGKYGHLDANHQESRLDRKSREH